MQRNNLPFSNTDYENSYQTSAGGTYLYNSAGPNLSKFHVVSNYPTSQTSSYYNYHQPAMTYNSVSTSSSSPIVTLLQNLQTRISNDIQQHSHDRQRSEILNQALAYIGNLNTEIREENFLLDLYLTINSVFNICTTTKTNLSSAIKDFFSKREDLLRGDSHDYFYRQSLANQFCISLAKIVFPNKSPINVLLNDALTKNRREPWQDVTTLESDIDSVATCFRTTTNCIHMYEPIVEQAIAILKRGYFESHEIWRGTDVKNLNSLTRDDLYILKQRTPTLGQLINHVEHLGTEAGFITKKFAELRKGLKAGAGGDFARKPSYVANQEFFEWWNYLSQTKEGKIIKARISEIKDLKNFLDILSSNNSIDTCVEWLVDELDVILGDYRNDLLKIEKNYQSSGLSDASLNQIRNQIMNELSVFQNIKTNKNYFEELYQSKDFMNRLIKNAEKMTLNDLRPSVVQPVFTPPPKVNETKTSSISNISSSKELWQPTPTVIPQPQVQQGPINYGIPTPRQKHGLFKHYREKREEKKIQNEINKVYKNW